MADQTKRIIYLDDTDNLIVIHPGKNETRTVDEIAKKDVPTGKSYKIINVSDLPSSREFRNAWTIDPLELTDGVGD